MAEDRDFRQARRIGMALRNPAIVHEEHCRLQASWERTASSIEAAIAAAERIGAKLQSAGNLRIHGH